jgi:hypothetical protein
LPASCKAHGYEHAVSEDDDSWVFTIERCTSGERMVREGKVKGVEPGWMYVSEVPEEYGWPVADVRYGPRHDGVPAVQEIIVLKEPGQAT